jgi:hypothetical protein
MVSLWILIFLLKFSTEMLIITMERELADLLSKLGYMYKNEDELIAKLHSGK